MILKRPTATLSLNEDCTFATIKLSGRSLPITSGVLGVERDTESKIKRVYLNARIHSPDAEWSGWKPTGAISTILERSA